MHPDWESLSSEPLSLTHHCSHGMDLHGPTLSISLPLAPLTLTLFLMLLFQPPRTPG